MKFDPQIHHRRSIRLKNYDYSQPGVYFITLVTKDRASLFGEITDEMIQLNVLGEIIRSTWLRLPEFFPLRHDEWVIMPNHLQAIIWILDSSTGEASAIPDSSDSHILIADASPQGEPIGTQPGSIGAIIQNFKSISTRKINQWMRDSRTDETSSIPGYENLKSQSGSASPQQIWQRNYYEHIVRNDLEFGRIQQYIDRNPSQWVTDQENPNKIG